MARSMDDPEVRRFLSEGTRTGKLAWTSADGQALVTPIWFVVDEDAEELEVVFNTGAETAKGRAMPGIRASRCSSTWRSHRTPTSG